MRSTALVMSRKEETVKEWKYFEYEQCPRCGDDLEVFNAEPEGIVYDGDEIRCVECDFRSGVSVDDEEIWVQDV